MSQNGNGNGKDTDDKEKKEIDENLRKILIAIANRFHGVTDPDSKLIEFVALHPYCDENHLALTGQYPDKAMLFPLTEEQAAGLETIPLTDPMFTPFHLISYRRIRDLSSAWVHRDLLYDAGYTSDDYEPKFLKADDGFQAVVRRPVAKEDPMQQELTMLLKEIHKAYDGKMFPTSRTFDLVDFADFGREHGMQLNGDYAEIRVMVPLGAREVQAAEHIYEIGIDVFRVEEMDTFVPSAELGGMWVPQLVLDQVKMTPNTTQEKLTPNVHVRNFPDDYGV